jgi:hypothetical protein
MLALAVGFIVAALVLLAAAGTARGEAIEGLVEVPTEAPAQVVAAPAAPPDPVQVPTGEAQAPTPVAEVPSEAPDVPAATATSATEPVRVTSPSPAAAPVQQVSKLVEDVGHDSTKRIGGATEQLPAVPASPGGKLVDTVAPKLTNAVANQANPAMKGFANEPLLVTENLVGVALAQVESTTVGDLLTPVATLLQTAVAPGATHFLPMAARPFSLLPRSTIGFSPVPSIAAPEGAELVAVAYGAAERLDWREALPTKTTTPMAGAPLARAGGDRAGSPVPSDVPPPAPGVPGAVASGSGGPIFVPIAALLALLALAAPAALRRLGRVPDLRPPAPFVCALERPG